MVARDGWVRRPHPPLPALVGGLPHTPIACSASIRVAGPSIVYSLALAGRLQVVCRCHRCSHTCCRWRRMVIMAGMLPGVECARRRRIRQGGAAEAPCGTRRPAFCLYNAGGHDHAHWGSAASKERSSSGGACKEMARAWWTLDSSAREAKERLDQKLRGQRESVAKRRQRTHATSTSGGADGSSSNEQRHSSPTAATAEAGMLQREVLSKPRNVGGARGFSWSRLGRCMPAPPPPEECAVCLEELRAGDVVARLPCAHRFHWPCAVPWVQAASRCPVCRAHVVLLASSPS